ncbi:methyltransferase (plasmid) [Aquabacterium olei]|uniref:Methyltransferase n=1 Tax=Aquabacterium olei TaxID=1296669 RepID=A0A2U8FXI5_9BURK|nr:class I SAM-dependent methyltransferase [Aquabacterium olei]AWI55508.1 methyltransferase [Aquabacterium olei]
MHHDTSTLSWSDGEATHTAAWRSVAGLPPPRRVVVADDTLPADRAYKLACEGTGLLWQGDFQNARHLLQALQRRIDKRRPRSPVPVADAGAAFHAHRQAQGQRARVLGMVLIPFDVGHVCPLRRAPDVQAACAAVFGPGHEPGVMPLRDLLGLIGAHEWRKKGVPLTAVGGRIHAHHGVFSPVRGEYVDLVAQAPLPASGPAFDIGTGTGVLAAVLARRGVQPIVATDLSAQALACAQDNLSRLGLAQQVTLQQADLFPPGRATLVVCNPPWLPAKPTSPLEHAVYDPDSRMLRGFLSGLRDHLTADGEGWLILSDLAEHLNLRSRESLLQWIAEAGLVVAGRLDARPVHPKASDPTDPLHRARAREVTSLWRLRAAPAA